MDDLGRSALAALFQNLFFANPTIGRSLLLHCGGLEKIFAGDRSELRSFFGGHHKLYRKFIEFDDWDHLTEELDQLLRMGGQILALSDESYPGILSKIYDPPPALQFVGRAQGIFDLPAVGIVGSRKASSNARELAFEIARDLSARGIVVVSGLAHGVDGAAHHGVIAAGGRTIAVLGAGLDSEYPRGHDKLRDSIKGDGLIISEFPLHTEPYPANFPQRNRIISGLSMAVIVVEAAKRSGSLITARFAMEQGREVMAVPGMGGSSLSKGSNSLIRDGAALVENADDVMEILSDRLPKGICDDLAEKRLGHLENDRGKDTPLLEALPRGKVVSVDDIIALTGLKADFLLGELTNWMIAGIVEELPGRYYRRR